MEGLEDYPRIEVRSRAELLCVGGVDSKPRKLDAARSMLLVAPRKPKSAWSKLNRDRVARLTEAGLK